MQRRPFLRAAGAALLAGRVPTVDANEEPFAPIGRRPLAGAKEAVVSADGRTAYLAVTDGFATVDVADPTEPTVLAERRDLLAERDAGPIREVNDVAADGDLLAVAGPAHGPTFGGVLLYDVSDPADPRRLDVQETSHPVHNCDVADGTVYITANNDSDRPVVTLDASGGSLETLGRWSPLDHDEAWGEINRSLRDVHDVTVVDGVAYAAYWDAGTWLLDVSDPSSPSSLGNVGGRTPEELLELSRSERAVQLLEPPGNAHYAEPGEDGDLLAVGRESWAIRTDLEGGPSGIDLWDVSEPSAPERLATIDPLVPADPTPDGTWTTAHNFELVGGRLYSSWYQDGVKVHDVSDPSSPELLAHWRSPDEARFWTARLARPDEFFVASDAGRTDGDGTDAALYCFPDRAGEQPDQPPIETPTPTPTRSPTPTGTPSPSPSPTRTPTPTPTVADSPTPGGGRGPTGTPTTPGFGPLAALAGLGAATWRLVRRRA